MLLRRPGSVLGLVLLSAVAAGQQSAPLVGSTPTVTPVLLEIYQIDLDPTGRMFSFGKPVLQGDAWTFIQWPDRTRASVPKSQIKEMKLWTKDLNKEVVYRIHLLPSGKVIAKDEPKLANGSFTFHTYVGGNLQALRQRDVRGIERLTGIEAFKEQQGQTGTARIGDLPMQGGGSVKVIGEEPAKPASPSQGSPDAASGATGGSVWIYQGMPGVTDGYAPAPSSIAYPGDVPKAAPPPGPTANPH
jgi:hypothetical protein